MKTIFPVCAIDRNVVHWEDYLDAATPWEQHDGIWFKREDYFAPLGVDGLNGSKVRQLIWYIQRYRGGKSQIITGASVQSPQLSSTAIVGAHYGLPVREVVYSKPHTLATHDNARIAQAFGAEFIYAAGPYNPILQHKVTELAHRAGRFGLVVEYGITLPHDRYPASEVMAFHNTGARQVANVPPQVETLIMPAGSCNTLTSVILGLCQHPHNVSTLFTVGVGPDKRIWAAERLRLMGIDVRDLPFAWEHYSLHDSGYAQYSQHFDGEGVADIAFHPTYEAKIWRWLRETTAFERLPFLRRDKTGFWIVGGPVKPAVVAPYAEARHA